MEPIKTILALADAYKKLPGIGPKTAERLAYATLRMSPEDRELFIQAIQDSMDKVKRCPHCGFYFEESCPICADPSRDHCQIMVVCDSKDILAIEKAKGYGGIYFVLDGTLSPLRNKTPESIGILRLLKEAEENSASEIILALPTDLDGETTALYIADLFAKKGIKVTRLAYGIPVGTNLEYLDNLTIAQSIRHRTDMDKGGQDNG